MSFSDDGWGEKPTMTNTAFNTLQNTRNSSQFQNTQRPFGYPPEAQSAKKGGSGLEKSVSFREVPVNDISSFERQQEKADTSDIFEDSGNLIIESETDDTVISVSKFSEENTENQSTSNECIKKASYSLDANKNVQLEKPHTEEKKSLILPPESSGSSRKMVFGRQVAETRPKVPPHVSPLPNVSISVEDKSISGYFNNNPGSSENDWQSEKPSIHQQTVAPSKRIPDDRAPSFMSIPQMPEKEENSQKWEDSWLETKTAKVPQTSPFVSEKDGIKPQGFGESLGLKPQGFGFQRMDDDAEKEQEENSSSQYPKVEGYVKWSSEASLFGKNELVQKKIVTSFDVDEAHKYFEDESAGAKNPRTNFAGFGISGNRENGDSSSAVFGDAQRETKTNPFIQNSVQFGSEDSNRPLPGYEEKTKVSENPKSLGFGESDKGFGQSARDFGEDRAGQSRPPRTNDDACRNCGESGHFSRECTKPQTCKYCHLEGHLIADCPTKKPRKCHNCQEEGHMASECKNERVEFQPTEPCRRCQEVGHWSRECPTRRRDAEGNIIPPYEMKLKYDDELFEDIIENEMPIDDNQVVTLSRGKKQFKAVNSFEEFNMIPEQVLMNLKRMKLKRPTPIQQAAFHEIYNGNDVVASAHTGCGKTLAFLLPLIVRLLEEDWTDDGTREEIALPRLLIIAPTRELAVQTFTVCRQVAYKTGLTTSIVYGGTSRAGNSQNLKIHNKLSILVATIGRLNDFIESKDIELSKLKYVVLDEADRMVDMNDFGKEVNEMLGEPDKRASQVCLFSASFSTDLQVGDLLTVVKKDYSMIDVNKFGTANENIHQSILLVSKADKNKTLLEILGVDENNFTVPEAARVNNEKTLIFVNTIKYADTLASSLSSCGLAVISMHRDHDQQTREDTLEKFKKGAFQVLVASNVAARGLDITHLDHVINYDMPEKQYGFDEYVNRIGRTGRAGFKGESTSFFCEETDMPVVENLVDVIKEAGKKIPDWLLTMYENRDAVVEDFGEEEAW